MFIVFEGIDGSGKSTQSNLLYNSLKKEGFDVVHTRPEIDSQSNVIVDSEIMTKIKSITHNTKYEKNLDLKTELLLYMAQIAQMTSEIIEPALGQKKIVISDRYIGSVFAYFFYGKLVDESLVKLLGNFVTNGVKPDMVILTDLSASVAFERKEESKKSLGRKELLGVEFFEKVRNGFLDLANQEQDRWTVLDNENLSEQDMKKDIYEKVFQKLRK